MSAHQGAHTHLLIQAGAIVDGYFGPEVASSSASNESSTKNRARAVERGVVLRSFHENHWLVHWFSIQRCAHIHYNQLKVFAPATAAAVQQVKQITEEYIGGVNELKRYFDSYEAMKKPPTPDSISTPVQTATKNTPTVSPSPTSKKRKTAKRKPAVPNTSLPAGGKMNQSFF